MIREQFFIETKKQNEAIIYNTIHSILYTGSYEQSPRFMEAYGDPLDSENVAVGSCESQLREDLAEAMLEISIASHRAPGKCVNDTDLSFSEKHKVYE